MKNDMLKKIAKKCMLIGFMLTSVSLIYCAASDKKSISSQEQVLDYTSKERIETLQKKFEQWLTEEKKKRLAEEKKKEEIEITLKKDSRNPLLSQAVYCMQPSKRTRSNSDLDAPAPKKTRSNEFENLDELENNDPERWKSFWPF